MSYCFDDFGDSPWALSLLYFRFIDMNVVSTDQAACSNNLLLSIIGSGLHSRHQSFYPEY